MARNWDDEPDRKTLQAWVYNGLKREEWGEWMPVWIPVEVVRGDLCTAVIRREDGMMAVVHSYNIWHGERRIDHPGGGEPKWCTEDDLMYA